MAKILARTHQMSREEWLKVRMQGVGGSDIAAIAGVSPFRNALSVYLSKVQENEDKEQTEAQYWGNMLEDIIAREFRIRHPEMKVQRVNAVLQHDKIPIALANIDRQLRDPSEGMGVFEAKTTAEHNKRYWDDGVPMEYVAQCQWYMGITDLPYAHIACLIGGQKWVEVKLERDPEIFEYLVGVAQEFWKLVESRTLPAIDSSEKTAEILAKLYNRTRPESIALPEEYHERCRSFLKLKQTIKKLKDLQQGHENAIKAAMGEHEAAFCGDRFHPTWKRYQSSRFMLDEFRSDFPEVVEDYMKDSPYRKFDVKDMEAKEKSKKKGGDK